MNIRLKPHPNIYLRAAQKLGVAPSERLVIEDALSGIAAAIPDRRFVDPREYNKRVDYLLGDLSEIPTVVCL